MSSEIVRTVQEIFKQTLTWVIYATLVMLVVIPALGRPGYELGKIFGILAVFMFIITQIAGLIRRFGLSGTLKDIYKILLFSRAQQGILMFFFGLTHYLTVYLVPLVRINTLPSLALYSLTGLAALVMTLLLTLTSNIQSKKLLKKWWFRLHSLVYVISWTIGLHLIFIFQYQSNLYGKAELSTVLLAGGVMVLGVLQITSLIYSKTRKRSV